MGKFVKGDIVSIPFPFSNLKSSKIRPALIVATLTGDDVILCQITSKEKNDVYAIDLTLQDFRQGGLPLDSNIRPNRLFTGDSNIIVDRKGGLKPDKIKQVVQKIIEIVQH